MWGRGSAYGTHTGAGSLDTRQTRQEPKQQPGRGFTMQKSIGPKKCRSDSFFKIITHTEAT